MSTDTDTTTEVSHELTERFKEFYKTYVDTRDGSKNQLAELIQGYPREKQSLVIDWRDLYQFDPDLGDDVVDEPDRVLDYAKQALYEYDLPVDVDLSGADIRVTNLDEYAEVEIGRFGKGDEERLRQITGQVTKKSKKRVKVTDAAFECQRCGTLTYIPQDGGQQEPFECRGCERQGPWTLNHSESERIDHQRLRLQLPPEKAQGMGAEHIDVKTVGELVNTVEVGDRANATVIPGLHNVDDDSQELLLAWHADANYLEPEDAGLDEIDYTDAIDEIRELANSDDPTGILVRSIKPTHYGDEDAKLAIGLQLFGGVRKQNADGSTMRGTPHILLIGDPGTDKTGLLDYASDLAPRSVFTSGEGSSGVGLTAAVVNDDFSAGPTLEAGAMVLANDGLVALDEFDKLDEDQQTSMNEALSKQTVSVSKWGINATLNARTTLLAAANPEYGRFDLYQNIGDQLDLDPTLLSRFDLMFIIKDKPNEEQDLEIAEHINTAAYVGAKNTRGESVESELAEQMEPEVEPELLRKWIAYARDNVDPVLSHEAREYIKEQYVELRAASDRDDDAVPVTARKIEAFHRLSEAAARVRLSDTVELQDAELAVAIVKDCLKEVGIDSETGQFDADIIETGRSKTQRDRIKTIRGLIQSNMGETAHGAPHGKLKSECEAVGIDESKLEHEIEKLKNNGQIYEPKDGHYRTT